MQAKDIEGKTVVLTGKFAALRRAAAEASLTALGARVTDSLSKTTDILFAGDKAGSKLVRAAMLGVAVHDEATLVALLAGAAGGEALAGSGEKLADAAASATEMTRVVAELRAFVQALRQRKDITVTQAALGRKAGKAKLDRLRALRIPAELIELYAEVDGVHVEWRFTEPPGGGCMRIPPVSEWTRFTDDDSHYMNFGEEYEALLLDEVTPEGNTWLVRGKGEDGRAMVRFASAAEGADGVIAADSIVEYLRAAMRSGFVAYWPRCFKVNRHVSYAAEEQAVLRFRAAPVAPTALRVGGRVHFEYFSEGGRGQVLALLEVPASHATDFTGTRFVEVRADEGSVAWIPQKWLKGCTVTDAYEQLRAPAFALATDASGLADQLDAFARAIDGLAHYSSMGPTGMLPSNGRRAAGLLGARPLADAVALVLALDQAVARAQLDRRASRPLVPTGAEFNPAELARHGWTYTIAGVLAGLHAGLVVLAHHESARRDVPGAVLLAAQWVAQLAAHPDARALHERCTSATPLAAPRWGYQDPKAPAGLPEGAVIWAGTGF